MDILTLLGVIVALAAVLGGNLLEGGHTATLLQLTAFIIVAGGTLGAVMVQTPLRLFLRAGRLAAWVLVPPRQDAEALIGKLVEWGQVARKQGLLGLEPAVGEEREEFLHLGLQLLVDGTELETLRTILEQELVRRESRDLKAAKVYEAAGGYSPTLGILGAVLGLIHVMNNLGDPSKLGGGIAVAFVATVYGVGLANLFFLPMGNKLKILVERQAVVREMVIEGLVGIGEGENPRSLELRLRGFLE